MASSEPFVAGQSALWVQVGGANTEPSYLGCHQLEDVEVPRGDVELIYCPDESGQNKFKVSGSYQTAPDSVTTSIITDVTEVCDYLEQVDDVVPIYINKAKTGRRDIFTNYVRAFILVNARITNVTYAGLAARTPDDQTRSEQTFEISAEELITIFRPVMSRQTIAATDDMHNIVFCDDDCLTGFVSGDAMDSSAVVYGEVYYTTTGGATWAVTTTHPFSGAESIKGMACFDVASANRVLVGRGTADAGNAAEIGYSDDVGVTWVNVDVGSTNGQYVVGDNGIFALNWTHVWVVTTGGYIYFSANGGASWTTQDAGVTTVQNLMAVHFADSSYGYAVGANNAIAKTATGGDSWELVTGPTAEAANTALCVYCMGQNDAWVGYSSGKLYFTDDGGATWTERTFSGSGTGAVRNVKFYNDLVGYITHDTAAPLGTVLRTINGGQEWEVITTTSNSGLNGIYVCGPNKFFVAGNVNSGTAFVASAIGCS